MEGWASFCRFGDSLVVSSNHGNKLVVDDGSDASSRCLAQTSVASVGVLSLLARWAYSSAQGGLVDPEQKKAAADVMGCFIKNMLENSIGKADFHLALDSDWVQFSRIELDVLFIVLYAICVYCSCVVFLFCVPCLSGLFVAEATAIPCCNSGADNS